MYLMSFLSSFVVCFTGVLLIKKFFKDKSWRLGGIAIILGFIIAVLLNNDLILDRQKIGVLVASGLILIFGIFDDIFRLSWKKQFVFQIFISLIIVAFGVSVDYLTNPLVQGGLIRLDFWNIEIWGMGFPILGSLFIVLWLLFLMNSVNWLDGIDGLAGGVSLISVGTLFFLSIGSIVNQPPLGIMSIIIAGAVCGFVVFNFPPAKITMGTSGSIFLGFIIGALAIFSGGKVATTMMVLSLPILDAVSVVVQRAMSGQSIFKGGDRRHLHYRLEDRGWSKRKILIFYLVISLTLGILSLFLQSIEKAILLFGAFFAIAIFTANISRSGKV